MHRASKVALPLLLLGLASCASLAGLQAALQPPRISPATDRPSELRLLAPAAGRPLGGAALRVYAHVANPNAVGLTLTALAGTLFLEDHQAATVDFPLGLPLPAAGDTIIPLDVVIGFADVPGLANALLQVVDRAEARYRMDGQMRVDAGLFGQPAFGPMTLMQGSVPVRR